MAYERILYIAYLFKDNDKFYIAISIALILSGTFIMFIVDNGSLVNGDGFGGFELYEVFGDNHLGAGAIAWSLLCVFGGTFGLFQYFSKHLKKQ